VTPTTRARHSSLRNSQRDSVTAEVLEVTIAAFKVFEEALETALTELENVKLPLGFGRD